LSQPWTRLCQNHRQISAADDEILAIDDVRVRADALGRRLEQYKPGDRISVLVARRDRLLRLEMIVGAAAPDEWEISVDPAAGEPQRRWLASWLRISD
jgi:predicted metalloprotease with PDZ domain